MTPGLMELARPATPAAQHFFSLAAIHNGGEGRGEEIP